MDRQIVYPGAIPLDTDVLSTGVDVMTAIGYLAQAALGTGTVCDGLAISQTTAPAMMAAQETADFGLPTAGATAAKDSSGMLG